ncbi:DUF4242 domain-containing protein [Terriglobus roseus]|uniref:DUF4242 domain-containing protein n=1 Tax=Terriglobus roseus TaxID=392734 RepID=A0A1H4P7V9_9BACT|nr:DUF4242 domain-containing protein [Terriglobus roseus]SEC03425.1 Protein of unknown function [Terriglobus roseus]
MPKFVIERNVPGLGDLSADQLKAMSQTSCGVLQSMGPKIQWLESFVTPNKMYCVYIAPDAETIRQHARVGGFPAESVEPVLQMIGPTTAE